MHPPKVFISYSHDSKEHLKWVLKLATDLRNNGVDAFLDVWDIRPGDNFTTQINYAINKADHCIIVCTPRYREIAEERRISGVGYEINLIREASREKKSLHPWILPIVRTGSIKSAVPDWLINRMCLDWRSDDLYKNKFDELLRAIYTRSSKSNKAIASEQSISNKINSKSVEINIENISQENLEKLTDFLVNHLGSNIIIKRGENDK